MNSTLTFLICMLIALMFTGLGTMIGYQFTKQNEIYTKTIYNLQNIYKPTQNPLFLMLAHNRTNQEPETTICNNLNVIDCTTKLNTFFGHAIKKYPDLLIGIEKYDIELTGLPSYLPMCIGLLFLPIFLHVLAFLFVEKKCLLLTSMIMICSIGFGLSNSMIFSKLDLDGIIHSGFHNGTVMGLIHNGNFNKSDLISNLHLQQNENWVTFYNCTSNIDCFQKIFKVWENKTVAWVGMTNMFPYEADNYMDKILVIGIPIYLIAAIVISTIAKTSMVEYLWNTQNGIDESSSFIYKN